MTGIVTGAGRPRALMLLVAGATLVLASCAPTATASLDVDIAPPPSASPDPGEQLETAVRDRLATLSGDYAVAVRELTGEEREVSIRGDEAREPASVIKLFVAYAALDRVDTGELALDDAVRSGVSVADCLQVMIVISDNNCHWELVDLLGEAALRDQFAREGYPATSYPDGYGDDAANPAKTTSADDLALLIERLHEGELLSADSSAHLLDLMAAQIYRQRAPSGVPAAATVADKPGLLAVDDGLVNTNAALVSTDDGTYVIAIMGQGGTTCQRRLNFDPFSSVKIDPLGLCSSGPLPGWAGSSEAHVVSVCGRSRRRE